MHRVRPLPPPLPLPCRVHRITIPPHNAVAAMNSSGGDGSSGVGQYSSMACAGTTWGSSPPPSMSPCSLYTRSHQSNVIYVLVVPRVRRVPHSTPVAALYVVLCVAVCVYTSDGGGSSMYGGGMGSGYGGMSGGCTCNPAQHTQHTQHTLCDVRCDYPSPHAVHIEST